MIHNQDDRGYEWFLAILMFLCFQPYFIWGFQYFNYLIFLFALFLLPKCQNKVNIGKLLIIISLYIYLGIKSTETYTGIIFYLCSAVIFFVDYKFLTSIFDKFIRIYVVIMTISLFVHILVTIGLNIPYNVIDALNELKRENIYFAYPLMVTQPFSSGRFYGVFDEPGVVGTISAVILLARKMDMKNWENVLLLFFGIFSFSFTFYITTLIYIIIFANKKFKIYAICIGLLFLYIFHNNELVSHLLFRFTIENGSLAGDNRSNVDEFWYKSFQHSSDYYWGLGRAAKQEYNMGGASYKDLIISYGLIFFIVYIVTMLTIAFKKIGKKEILIYAFILFVIIYQRPFIGNISYDLLIYVPVLLLVKQNKKSLQC